MKKIEVTLNWWRRRRRRDLKLNGKVVVLNNLYCPK